MFTVPTNQSPLGQIFEGLTEAAGPYLQQRKAQKSSQALFDTLSQIGEKASPLEFTRLLHSNPNILPEHRASALKSYTDIQNAQSKQAAANRPRGGNITTGPGGKPILTTGAQTQLTQANIYLKQKGLPLLKPRDVSTEIAEWEDAHPEDRYEDEAPITTKEAGSTEESSASQPTTEEPELPPEEQFIPKDLTPKERTAWRKENKKITEPIRKEVSAKVAAHQKFNTFMNTLTKLNESGKLPSDAERWAINPETGDLYDVLKKLNIKGNPETQLWIKTLYEMAPDARKDYGARVTDFDLKTHMKRFPSLMNTAQGRRLILRQIQSVNKITEIYDQTLDQVYKKHGIENISPEKAEEEAERLSKDRIESVKKRYDESFDVIKRNEAKARGNVFFDKPDPSTFKEGQILKDVKTGKPAFVIKNGQWEKI